MRRRDTTAAAPTTLLTGVRDHHHGLRLLELEQNWGTKSYSATGIAWELEAEGEPTPADSPPDEDPEAIAAEVYAAAWNHREQHGGDARFRAVLYCATKSGATERHDVRFSVDAEPRSEKGSDVEARSRANFLDSVVSYVKLMHNMNIAQWKSMQGVFESVATVVRAPADMLPRVLDLRMEAFEDRAAALGLLEEGAAKSSMAEAKSERWKEAVGELKSMTQGPMGRAAVGRLLGLEGDELKKYVGLDDEQSDSAGGIRELLMTLYKKLDDKQKTTLREKVGASRVELLVTAATAPDEKAAAGCVAKFFAEVESAGLFGTLQEALTEEQAQLVARVMDELEKHTDDKVS